MTYVGGTYGVAMKPTPFICLAFKLLTLTPDKDIVLEYLERGGDEWKYLRALAAFYIRLTFDSAEVRLLKKKQQVLELKQVVDLSCA
jgi:pre-mRNA-splicing factor 38A